MTDTARYVKIVEWSEEDCAFVGQCPGIIGPCCHGADEVEVYRELCEIVSSAPSSPHERVNMDHTNDIAAICKRLLDVCEPTSIHIRIEIVQSDLLPNHVMGPEYPIKQEYAATSSGQRFFDDIFMPGSEPSRRMTVYSDHRKFAHVSYAPASGEPTRQLNVYIDKHEVVERWDFFVHAPEVIRLHYVGLEPLYEALPKAEAMPDGKVIGRSCDVFHFEKVGPPERPQSLVYFLDKATAVPLKVSAYTDPDHVRKEAPNWVWEAKTLDQISRRHFLPLSSAYTTHIRHDAGGGKVEMEVDLVQAIRIVQAEFDASMPASTFWPVPRPGVPVIDATANRIPKLPPGFDTTPEVGVPIRVGVLVRDTTFMGWAGAILGVLVFLVAFLFRRRAR